MSSWTINLGPVQKVDISKADNCLNEIRSEVRSFRMPSDIMIGQYAIEKRRINDNAIEALEEAFAASAEAVDAEYTYLKALVQPLMEKPPSGPDFEGFLNGKAHPEDNQHKGGMANG